MGADSDELRLVNEYRLMHGLAMQLFDSLKYLPHYGDHLWRPSFQRAFELFAKLWKYQQDHRAVLADEAHYGLTRWEIGVIAAKIGQLYYFYYLRTGDVGYLNESYVFYDAVRARRYFHDEHGGPSDTAAKLAVRLRYTTRFAVVCVLVGRRALHAELNDELTELVRQYATHAPPDLGEWQRVLADMRAVREQYDAVRVLGVPAASSPGARGAGISSPLALDDGIALSDGAPGGLSAGVAPGSGCAGGLPPGACGSQPPCAAGTAASSPPAMAAADGAGMALGGLLADTPCVATRPAPCSLPHASAQTHHHLGGIASAAGAGAELREALLVGTDPQQVGARARAGARARGWAARPGRACARLGLPRARPAHARPPADGLADASTPAVPPVRARARHSRLRPRVRASARRGVAAGDSGRAHHRRAAHATRA